MFPIFSWRCISTKLEVCNGKIELLTGQHEAKQGYMSTEWVKKGFDDIEGLTLHLPSEMPLTSICAVLICRRFSLRCCRMTMTESPLRVTGSTQRHQQVDAGLNQSINHHPSWGLTARELVHWYNKLFDPRISEKRALDWLFRQGQRRSVYVKVQRIFAWAHSAQCAQHTTDATRSLWGKQDYRMLNVLDSFMEK